MEIVSYVLAALLILYVLFIRRLTTLIPALILLAALSIIMRHAVSPSVVSIRFFNIIVKLFKRPFNLLPLNDLGNYFLSVERVLRSPVAEEVD